MAKKIITRIIILFAIFIRKMIDGSSNSKWFISSFVFVICQIKENNLIDRNGKIFDNKCQISSQWLQFHYSLSWWILFLWKPNLFFLSIKHKEVINDWANGVVTLRSVIKKTSMVIDERYLTLLYYQYYLNCQKVIW